MEITKISNDNFTLQKQGNDYLLLMGEIKKDTPRPFTIKISGVEDSSKVSVQSTCGCSTAEKTVIDGTTLTAKIAYNNCDTAFTKTIKINNNKKTTLLKIQGTCHN